MVQINENLATPPVSSLSRFFAKPRIIAKPGFNRWLVPPAALAVHLCIGMAYGFSVYWLPMSQLIGGSAPLQCPVDMSFWQQLVTRQCDWKISLLGWTYTLFFVFLGCSAALWGSWLEKVGPRLVSFVATLCWCGGLVLASAAIYFHQLWLLWLGAGVIGGIGLGLGYISPVSTLLRWFPDKRGMAAGMAIMGFGGGALVGAPLANWLINFFADGQGSGVWQSILALAVIYALFMLCGTFGYRLPPMGWHPVGAKAQQAISKQPTVQVHVSVAWRTPQFWLLWLVLWLNVTAGIGILGMASPMLQEIFAGKLLSLDLGWQELNTEQLKRIATMAAGFTGLLSLFNILGRFFWASVSDMCGRKATFALIFFLGTLLYGTLPLINHGGYVAFFVCALCVIISMYGGGFATIPAYLADVFGSQMVGAIHGRLLTAWSAAGISGPVLVNYLREYQLAQGVEPARIYDITLLALTGLLIIGFICNQLVRPIPQKYAMTAEQQQQARGLYTINKDAQLSWEPTPAPLLLTLSWLAVGIPLLWGMGTTLQQAVKFFM
ncbi:MULTISPECIES: OFA family MFS transporter [Klebsiella]|jgi:MFS family permease|uniref:OFA family MFS transporter n=4 Tax=Klebsiella aerogenes TaxID=548 RepID=A0AAJ5IKN4_KLEAE|nr:OFA family MFS transporter [Klebsiella aerogenes]MCL6718029.1 OFA family MFS transporter [Klebsiella sp. T2.Ur]AEG98452.1 major facilitator superfamily MFS_1 [Klebsiella aerogenes KCTC 2190]AMH12054.1 MFS transporter [Klebsiella aerogenes]AMQ61885.1 MFS transporter [Klebsiella aerogenes]ATX87570.1 MFS transporter [Klebsiella aerogenes]